METRVSPAVVVVVLVLVAAILLALYYYVVDKPPLPAEDGDPMGDMELPPPPRLDDPGIEPDPATPEALDESPTDVEGGDISETVPDPADEETPADSPMPEAEPERP